jgi:hypothetical protein
MRGKSPILLVEDYREDLSCSVLQFFVSMNATSTTSSRLA